MSEKKELKERKEENSRNCNVNKRKTGRKKGK